MTRECTWLTELNQSWGCMQPPDDSAFRLRNPVCCSLWANEKEIARRSLTSAMVVKCYWLLCVHWSRDRLPNATIREYLFERDVSVLMEWVNFQWLKPYVLLSSSHKDFVCFRRLGMQHNLFVMLLYRFLMVRFFNKYLWPYLHLPVTCFI